MSPMKSLLKELPLNYRVVIEKAKGNYSSYSPDVVGCVAVGKTIEQTRFNMKEALEVHLRGMLEDGEPLPIAQGESSCKATQESLKENSYFCLIQVEVTPEKIA